jgi:hypothetical protein
VSGVWICGWRQRPPYPPLRCATAGKSTLHSIVGAHSEVCARSTLSEVLKK